MRKFLLSCVLLTLTGCIHFESNPIPPSVELSPEQLNLGNSETTIEGVDFGLEVRTNESDSFANVEILPGLKVSAVHPNSPADFAGIDVNDVILSVDGVDTNDMDSLNAIAMKSQPDHKHLFVIRRGTTALEATVIARQSNRPLPLKELYRIDPIASRAAYRTEILYLPTGIRSSGARVVRMTDDSPLKKAGIQLGDLIVAINSQGVESAQKFVTDLIEDYSPGAQVTLKVISSGRQFDKQVRLWDPGRYLSRLQLWPLFRYEFRPDPKTVIFQFPEFLPIYRIYESDFESHHQFLFFFNIRNTRNPPDKSTYQ
ncbi:MAG: PDZ domain-containing protein [Gammaproteobacteria bacterium]|nr:PDZ domain-containing protein [Gammaproteobacteria bacterium]